MLIKFVLTVLLMTFRIEASVNQQRSDSLIYRIISKKPSKTPGKNFPELFSLQKLAKAHHRKNILLPSKKYEADFIASLPESFDPREKWAYCPSLHEIRDQGSCGSGYVFGAVEAMTDRICIHSSGTKQFHFSAEDLLTCCHDCGDCTGGDPYLAWTFWNQVGIVSGGGYNTGEGCLPYSFPSCKTVAHPPLHPTGFNVTDRQLCLSYGTERTPCSKKCGSTNISYEKDKIKGLYPYILKGENDMKAELFLNGPIEVSFPAYEDFFNYKRGVYVHVNGEYIYGHAVKLLGWGVEKGVKYWLCANSWNDGWGDKGFFKILRGEDHLGIENGAVAALPDLNKIMA